MRQASDPRIAERVSGGRAVPVASSAASPAASLATSNLTPVLSVSVSRIVTADSESSGPIPSPVIRDIRYSLSHPSGASS